MTFNNRSIAAMRSFPGRECNHFNSSSSEFTQVTCSILNASNQTGYSPLFTAANNFILSTPRVWTKTSGVKPLLAFVMLALLLISCGQSPPDTTSGFSDADLNVLLSEVGRFQPVISGNSFALIDTRLGDAYILQHTNWIKIPSPLNTFTNLSTYPGL